ncbi:MAG: sulfurtransferase complex subunit TusC [Pseudomonadales bacterium]|nr:sulfurtransferase complex subunit TusC [Pseudomonadales bacterium]MCP5331499.1 sulfurtransferase complex subunit TusC [Pseudomonadales bacterium]MCP5343382.1 sulfurtransferase complex subunit TusC [Pseudomonadales bacterium]
MEMTPKTLTFIARSTPYGSGRAKALLDMVLSAAVFDQNINLLFMDDGVWQLARDQQPGMIDAKDLSAALGALPLYEVNNVYVEARALHERGLTLDTLAVTAIPCDDAHITALIAQSDQVFAL